MGVFCQARWASVWVQSVLVSIIWDWRGLKVPLAVGNKSSNRPTHSDKSKQQGWGKSKGKLSRMGTASKCWLPKMSRTHFTAQLSRALCYIIFYLIRCYRSIYFLTQSEPKLHITTMQPSTLYVQYPCNSLDYLCICGTCSSQLMQMCSLLGEISVCDLYYLRY